MIFKFRLFGLVFELLLIHGLLFGFTLPQGFVEAVGINVGPFCACVYLDEKRPRCPRCGRTLRWGLHGNIGPLPLCRRK